MNTPRSGLIRATEGAIKEYIKDGCAENLPLIRQLEDVAFKFWVESNTSFLNETIETVDDDDEWIWDDEYLFQSFSANADDKFINAIDDANSSICSSIKPCDESDCSFGYLASCEDNDIMNLSGKESLDLSENDINDINITDNIGDSQTNSLISASCVKLTDENDIHYQTLKLNEVESLSMNCDTSIDNHDLENDTENIIKLGNTNEELDEWVVVNYDVNECVPNSEWFIVSVKESSENTAGTKSNRQVSPIDMYHRSDDNNVQKLNNNHTDDVNGAFDLSEWAVLSMQVSENSHTCVSEEKKILKKEADFTHRPESSDILAAYKKTAQMEFIQETFGFKEQSSCERSSVKRCPLCKSRKENYKCAIFCLLLD